MTEATQSPGGDPSLDDLVSTGKPSLANLAVVDKLVRDFAASVLLVKSGFQRGEPEAKEPLQVIERQAQKMGNIIMGRDPAYDAQPWNNSNRLGNVLRVLLPDETRHYGDPGTALFMWLANQALKASAHIDDGHSEDSAKARLAEVCDDVTARILGVR